MIVPIEAPVEALGLLGSPEFAEHLDQIGCEWQHTLGGFALRRNKLTATVQFANLLIDGEELMVVVDAEPVSVAHKVAYNRSSYVCRRPNDLPISRRDRIVITVKKRTISCAKRSAAWARSAALSHLPHGINPTKMTRPYLV